MEIAAESGLGTTLLGNLMVANRPLATPAVLAIPIFHNSTRCSVVSFRRLDSSPIIYILENGFHVIGPRLGHLSHSFG